VGNDGTSWLLFDYSRSAGYFSQLSGVLAGFAFLAITLLLNRQHRRRTEADAAESIGRITRLSPRWGCALLGLVAAAADVCIVGRGAGLVADQ